MMKKFFGLFTQYQGLRPEIYVLFFGRIVTNLGAMVWPMLTMILSRKMGMSASTIAVVTVAASALMLPANLLGGRLADRRSKKAVIVSCDAASVLCYLVAAAVPLSYFSLGLLVAAGICQSMEYPSYNALIADLTLTKDRERAYSLQYLGGNLGLVLSPTIGGLLFEKHLNVAFLLSGLSIALSTVLIFLKIKNVAPEVDESDEGVYQKGQAGVGLLSVLRENPLLVLFTVALSLYYSAYGQYTYLLPLDMGRVHGETGAVIFGTVSSLNCIVVVLFTPLITRLFSRVRDPQKILVGEGLVALGYTVFLLLLGVVPAYYAAMLLFTWGEIFATIAEGPYLSARVPETHRGRINGFSSVLAAVLQGGVELTVGHAYDAFGSKAAWTLVLCVLALSCAFTVLLLLRDRRRYPALWQPREASLPQTPPEQTK